MVCVADGGLVVVSGPPSISPEPMGALGPIRNPLGIEGFTSVYKVLLYTISRFCTAQRPSQCLCDYAMP